MGESQLRNKYVYHIARMCCSRYGPYYNEKGDLVFYREIQQHYRHCLGEGKTLEEAIKLMETANGA